VWLGLGPWLPSHRAPFVLCRISFLVLGVAFFAFAGAGLLCLLRGCLVLMVLVHEGLVACEV